MEMITDMIMKIWYCPIEVKILFAVILLLAWYLSRDLEKNGENNGEHRNA